MARSITLKGHHSSLLLQTGPVSWMDDTRIFAKPWFVTISIPNGLLLARLSGRAAGLMPLLTGER
jgi:hypothetical protein